MGLKLRRAERLDSALARAPDSRVARRGVVDRRQAHLQDRLTLTTHRGAAHTIAELIGAPGDIPRIIP